MDNGYILVSRKLIESDIFSKPPMYLKLWMWLLIQARFAETKGLKRGQVRTTYEEMREAMTYYVGFRRVKPSKSDVFRVLEYMRNTGRNGEDAMIETAKTTRHILITICNYNDYQSPDFYERNDEDTVNETTKSLRTVTRKDKNDKNDIYTVSKDTVRSTDPQQPTQRQKVMDKWNELPLPNVRSINPNTKRFTMLNARMKEYGLGAVLEAIDNIAKSPFLLGQNGKWVIDFDWFIAPNNFPKVYEGRYNERNDVPETKPFISAEDIERVAALHQGADI